MGSITALIIIMVAAGSAGGYANYLLSASGEGSQPTVGVDESGKPLGWWGYIVLGVVATFIVPLFLSLAQSDLFGAVLKAEGLTSDKVFVFVGFCLIAAISSRAFIQTVSARVIALARRASQTAAETKEQQQTMKTEVEELGEIIGSQPDTAEQTAEAAEPEVRGPEQQLPQLSSDDFRVLEALRAKPYRRRTLNGVVKDSGINAIKVQEILGKLTLLSLVRDIPSKKTQNLLYELTSRGAYALSAKST